MYGAYLLAYQYGRTDDNIESLFSSNAIVGDISTSEAIDFVIPYRNTHNFLTTYPLTGDGSDESYCTVFLANLFTESVSGGTNSLDYDVFFTLENVDGAFPTSDSEVYPQSRIYKEMLENVQESRNTQELSMYEKGVNHARFPYASTMALGAVAVGTSMKAIYDRHFGRSTETDNVLHEQEEDAPSNDHAGKAKNVRQSYYGDLATLRGQDMPTLSEEVVPSFMYKPTEMNMSSDMSIRELGDRPGIHAISLFTSTAADANINMNFIMGGNRATVVGRQPFTFGSYISRHARYYRCDHKVALHFHTSPLISARFRVDIQYRQKPSAEGISNGDQSYEVPSEVFLIKGSQIKTFLIPFMANTSVMPIGTTYVYMNIKLLTPPSTIGATSSSIYMLATTSHPNLSIYMLATTSHPNLSIYSLQSAYSTEAAPVNEVLPQSGVRQVHESIPESSFEGHSAMVPIGMPELASLKAIISRFDTSKLPITSIDTLPVPLNRTDWNEASNLISVTRLFAFISGSIENRITYSSEGTGARYARLGNFTEASTAEGRVGDGQAITLLPAWPILDFRTPYRASVPMVWRVEDSRLQAPNMADVDLDMTNMEKVFVRAGRDFAMHYLNYVPSIGWCKPFFIG